MDGYFQDDAQEDLEEDLEDEQLAEAEGLEAVAEQTQAEAAEADDNELMTIVDPLIDKVARDSKESALDDDLDDSEFDDDSQFDELDEFLSDDPDDVDELVALDDDPDMGDVVMDADLEGVLDSVLKEPLTASQQALQARRAIEARAEARRIDRDLNYLDFELDD